MLQTPHSIPKLSGRTKNVLEETGFQNVSVTRYSQDGGIDVNALPARISGQFGICSFKFKQNDGCILSADAKSLNFAEAYSHLHEVRL